MAFFLFFGLIDNICLLCRVLHLLLLCFMDTFGPLILTDALGYLDGFNRTYKEVTYSAHTQTKPIENSATIDVEKLL